MEVEKIIRVAEVHLQTFQGKLEDILVEVAFNSSESSASFFCSPDRLFGEHFGFFLLNRL